jgi:hypothetical protein
MKMKLLTIAVLTLAVTSFATAQTDPFLFGLRAKLPNTEKLRDVRIATLFEVWHDATGHLQSNGYLEMGFKRTGSTNDFVLNVRSVAQMSDANGALLLRGRGQLRNVTEHTSKDVYVEWYGVDRRKQNSGPGDHRDAFAIRFWVPNTDLDVASRWEFPEFHQVEIYRPNN